MTGARGEEEAMPDRKDYVAGAIATERDVRIAAISPIEYHEGRRYTDYDWLERHWWATARCELELLARATRYERAVQWPQHWRPHGLIGFVPHEDGATVWRYIGHGG